MISLKFVPMSLFDNIIISAGNVLASIRRRAIIIAFSLLLA